MSGFKLVLKLPKPAVPKQAESRPIDSGEPKRKRQQPEGGHTAKRIKREPGTEASRPAEEGRAGPSSRHTSDPRPAERAAVGSEAASQAPAKPRLVIKFKAKPPENAPDQGGSGAQSELREHKEKKKKKKLRNRPPEQDEKKPRLLPKLPPKVRPAAPVADPGPSSAAAPAERPKSGAVKSEPRSPRPPKVSPRTSTKPLAVKAEPQATPAAAAASADVASSHPPGPPGSRPAGQEAVGPAKPDMLPGAGDVEKLLNRLQRKDVQSFFRDPVTDAVAPGYSEVIKRPMSFAQMRERLAAGEYTAWLIVQQDLETMFNNAMVFNAPTSVYHQKARELMGIARKWLLQLRTTGQLDGRGRKPGSAKPKPPAAAANAAAAPASTELPEKRPERRAAAVAATKMERVVKPKVDKKKLAARKAAARAAASGVLARPGLDDGRGDLVPLSAEEDARATFLPLLGAAVEQQFKGLARGASASGVAFAGRPTIRENFTGVLTLDAYTKSLKVFGKRLTGRAREWMEQLLTAAAKPPEPKPAWPVPGSAPGAQMAWKSMPMLSIGQPTQLQAGPGQLAMPWQQKPASAASTPTTQPQPPAPATGAVAAAAVAAAQGTPAAPQSSWGTAAQPKAWPQQH